MIRRPPTSPLFPYPTLSRSVFPAVTQRQLALDSIIDSMVETPTTGTRSEEHTSELQSQSNLVCRLLLEKKRYRPSRHALRRHHERPIILTHAPKLRPLRLPF